MKLIIILTIFFAITFSVGCSVSADKAQYGVYGQADDFLADPVTGCLIDKSYFQSDEPIYFRWEGQCIDGYAIGKGRLTWTEENGREAFHFTCLRPEHRQANCYTGSGMQQ